MSKETQSFQVLLERAVAENLYIVSQSVRELGIDGDELAAQIGAVAERAVQMDTATEGAEALLMLFGWGAILGYYYGLKKVGDEVLAVQSECGDKQ